MENTNEIEKQLKLKADAYIEQKANEMYAIHEEIVKFLGGRGINFIDYITHFDQYQQAKPEDKCAHKAYTSPPETKNKYKIELAMNYKDRLVAKYTKELISKLEIFE